MKQGSMVAQSPISCLCCCLLSFLLMVLEEQAFVSLRKSQVSRLRCCCAVVLTDFISSLCPGSRITESVDILCVLKGSTVALCGTQHFCMELFGMWRSPITCFTMWDLLWCLLCRYHHVPWPFPQHGASGLPPLGQVSC